ncbi:MAG: amino acid permease, partial [Myxococcota bacterium]
MTSPGPRRLGVVTATLTVAASMVGTGVFTTTGYLVADIGSPIAVLIAWAVGGVVALAGALCYAELGAMIPENGGEYTLIDRVWHPSLGFVAAVISIVVGFAAPIAAASLAFAAYVRAAWPTLPVDDRVLAVGLVAVGAGIHATRVHLGAAALNVVTAIQLATVAAVLAVGIALGDVANLGAGPPVAAAVASPAFAVGLVYVGFSYAGWNAAAYLAGELRDPHATLPRALGIGTVAVTVLYVGLNAGILMAAPPSTLAGAPEVAHTAAVAVLGPRGGQVLSAVV